ncbi:RHS repeat-associated core domain-containing protein [Bordetella bronchialis]|uniref:RHS repeat-associated core domain-containing protein n=1 Tax=Bordetella bronchialis TaxID=463025 RepID=A0A193FWA3_9BORD|nr:RHS repeat-associated core domain-containing protein [Bordetella bronchialis]ANN71466.1 hypothetical protein BAU08_09090 [Bordetella bronchialis]
MNKDHLVSTARREDQGATAPAASLRYAGEIFDPVAAGYSLGNGYRLLLPPLMRFCAPDALSPFAWGGINPYAYGKDDPIDRADPTGHIAVEALDRVIPTLESLAARTAVQALKGTGKQTSTSLPAIEEDLAREGPIFKQVQHAVWQSPMQREPLNIRRLSWTIQGKRAEIYFFENDFGRYGRQANLLFHGISMGDETLARFADFMLVGPDALAGQAGDLSRYDVVRLLACNTANGTVPFAQSFARAVDRPVIGFKGSVGTTFPLPEHISDIYGKWEKLAKEYDLPGYPDQLLQSQFKGRVFKNYPSLHYPQLFFPD